MTEDNNNKREEEKVEKLVDQHEDELSTNEGELPGNTSEGVEFPGEVVEKAENDEVFKMKDIFKKKKENEEKLKRLQNENETLKDRLLRLNAEYENYRKRTQKEKEAIYSDSIVDVIKELLPVLDNLETSLKVEVVDVEGLRKGVEMTLSQFNGALSKLKVTEVDTNIPFDPNFHNAVMHVEDPSLGQNEIAEVFMKGFQREDKIIRYSVVKVAN
ncbi:MAG: nucleotide exchange factor GrpE [Clostridiaceae bacterium]